MIVYVVWIFDPDGATVHGVYANKEKAERIAKRLSKAMLRSVEDEPGYGAYAEPHRVQQ